jgi:hypothetical protein
MKPTRLRPWLRLFRPTANKDRGLRYREPTDELMRLHRQYNNVGARIMEGRQQLSKPAIANELYSDRYEEAA